MSYRVATVSFLNAWPLVDRLTELSPDVDLSSALPSRLAALLEAGAADIALLPVVEAFRGRGGEILRGTGIACRGEVASVMLFANGSLEDLGRVRADRGSRSSVALLEILLRESTGRCPEFDPEEPRPDHMPDPREGVLVIGDRCLAFDHELRTRGFPRIRSHDLGRLWLDLTGLPFVFAAWILRPGFAAERGAAAVQDLEDLLQRARDHGLADLDRLAERAAAEGFLGAGGEATAAAIAYYFRHNLRYRLGPEEEAGLLRFHELCLRHGLVPADSRVSFTEG